MLMLFNRNFMPDMREREGESKKQNAKRREFNGGVG